MNLGILLLQTSNLRFTKPAKFSLLVDPRHTLTTLELIGTVHVLVQRSHEAPMKATAAQPIKSIS